VGGGCVLGEVYDVASGSSCGLGDGPLIKRGRPGLSIAGLRSYLQMLVTLPLGLPFGRTGNTDLLVLVPLTWCQLSDLSSPPPCSRGLT
jgi:hypothetical protein